MYKVPTEPHPFVTPIKWSWEEHKGTCGSCGCSPENAIHIRSIEKEMK